MLPRYGATGRLGAIRGHLLGVAVYAFDTCWKMSKPADPSSFLCNVSTHLRVFQAFIGWPLYVVFALRLVAALVEGIGIVMLMPLLQRLDENGSAVEAPTRAGLGGGIPDSLANLMDHVGLTS